MPPNPILNYTAPSRAERWAARFRDFRRTLKNACIVLLIFWIVGYVSNYLSVSACEDRLALWVAKKRMGGLPFNSETPAIFKRIGVDTPLGHVQPWADVNRTILLTPFITEVHYEYGRRSEMGTCIYFTFFGLAFQIEEPRIIRIA